MKARWWTENASTHSARQASQQAVRPSAYRRVPPELRGSGAGGVAGIAEASVRSEHPAEGACGQSRRPGSMRYHPPRNTTTAPGRRCPKAPPAEAIRKRARGRIRRQGDSPPSRTCRPSHQTLQQFGRTCGAPECTAVKGDDTLRPYCVIRSCRPQNKAGSGRRRTARSKNTPPWENPSQREPYRSTVALFRAAGWSTAREHQQGHPTVELTLQRASRSGTSNCQEPAFPPRAYTGTVCAHGGVLTRRRSRPERNTDYRRRFGNQQSGPGCRRRLCRTCS